MKKADPEKSQDRPLLIYISACSPALHRELTWLIGDIYDKGEPIEQLLEPHQCPSLLVTPLPQLLQVHISYRDKEKHTGKIALIDCYPIRPIEKYIVSQRYDQVLKSQGK